MLEAPDGVQFAKVTVVVAEKEVVVDVVVVVYRYKNLPCRLQLLFGESIMLDSMAGRARSCSRSSALRVMRLCCCLEEIFSPMSNFLWSLAMTPGLAGLIALEKSKSSSSSMALSTIHRFFLQFPEMVPVVTKQKDAVVNVEVVVVVVYGKSS